mgnify:CR=1 FL=1
MALGGDRPPFQRAHVICVVFDTSNKATFDGVPDLIQATRRELVLQQQQGYGMVSLHCKLNMQGTHSSVWLTNYPRRKSVITNAAMLLFGNVTEGKDRAVSFKDAKVRHSYLACNYSL